MIFILFFIGFILGIIYALIADEVPLLLEEVTRKENNSWILNLFIGIVNALVMLVSYYEYGFSYEFLASLIVAELFIIIFITDFKYMIILDSPLILSSLIILGLKVYFYNLKTAGIALLSGLGLFIFMLLIAILGKKIFKREALGGGDIKLAFVMGTIMGFRLGLISIIFSSLLALPYALGTMMLCKDREVPYGPFLISTMTLVFMFSDKFLNLVNFLF